MADWFVYQQDLYVDDLDADSLGVTLLPFYDGANKVQYTDDASVSNNGLRRVRSYWGVDRDTVQLDIHLQSIPTQHAHSHLTQTLHWYPRKHHFQFTNGVNGFRFENVTQQQCLVVTREPNNVSYAELLQKDVHGQYTSLFGTVMFVRLHKLTLLSPPALDTTMFAKFVTAHTPLGLATQDMSMSMK